jgi:hypothetical protein
MTPPHLVGRAASVPLLLAGLLSLANLAGGQSPRADATIPMVPHKGTELFRGLFRLHGVNPVSAEEAQKNDFRNLIVVILGHPKHGDVNAELLASEALRQGGAVLIAIEEKSQLKGYFPQFTDAVVTGETVVARNTTTAFAQNRYCPFVVPIQPVRLQLENIKLAWDGRPHWELFNGLDRVAVNNAGTIVVTTRPSHISSIVATFPKGCAVEPGGGDLAADRVFALAGSGRDTETFRCLVMADPSVFSNQMLATSVPGTAQKVQDPLPTQNLLFADRVVRFLRGPNDRTKCLFIESGKVRSTFDDVKFESLHPLPPVPVPPLPDPLDPELQARVTDAINHEIAALQDRDALNRRLTNGERYNRTLYFLAAVVACAILAVLLRRAWKARHEPDVLPVPSDTGRMAVSGPPGSLARRREEILQSGSYTDVVREYLQEMFTSHGLPTDLLQPAHRLPAVHVTGPGNTTLREYLRILWGVAFGTHPGPISYARWKELEPMIDAVRRAADEGRWRFADTGDTGS